MENSQREPVVEVMQSGAHFPPLPASTQVKGNLASSPWDVARSVTTQAVTYPDVPRLPLQDAAIALVKGEPGSGWSIARDVAEVTAIVALGMGLTGCKDVWKPALVCALLVEAMVVAYTAAGIRACETMRQAQEPKA
jgi:hypothetical protein